MITLKFVVNSIIRTSFIITDPLVDQVVNLFIEDLVDLPLDLSNLNEEQAKLLKEELLELNTLVGVDPEQQDQLLTALRDLEKILQHSKHIPTHRECLQGVLIEQEGY